MKAEIRSDRVGAPYDDEARQQVSALLDGELDDVGCERAIDALLASDELVVFWADAHRAGDWMRSDEVTGVGDGQAFMHRFSAALDKEPTVLAPTASPRTRSKSKRSWLRAGIPGASVAAALVAVVWMAAPAGRDAVPDRVVALAPVAPAEPLVAVSVPAVEQGAPVVDADGLSDYFAAHRDVTPFGYRGAMARPATYVPSASQAGALRTQ